MRATAVADGAREIGCSNVVLGARERTQRTAAAMGAALLGRRAETVRPRGSHVVWRGRKVDLVQHLVAEQHAVVVPCMRVWTREEHGPPHPTVKTPACRAGRVARRALGPRPPPSPSRAPAQRHASHAQLPPAAPPGATARLARAHRIPPHLRLSPANPKRARGAGRAPNLRSTVQVDSSLPRSMKSTCRKRKPSSVTPRTLTPDGILDATICGRPKAGVWWGVGGARAEAPRHGEKAGGRTHGQARAPHMSSS